jgi:hypothetical protein
MTSMAAAHRGQLCGELFHRIVGRGAGLDAGGAEDGDAIGLAGAPAQAGEFIDDIPQPVDGVLDHGGGGVFIADANDIVFP